MKGRPQMMRRKLLLLLALPALAGARLSASSLSLGNILGHADPTEEEEEEDVGGSPDDLATFTLYDNGASTGGVEVTIARKDFPQVQQEYGLPAAKRRRMTNDQFASAMSQKIKVQKYDGGDNVVAHKAFREDGEEIVRFSQLLPADGGSENNRRVYIVAEDLEFVWPFVQVGHNQTISTNVVPPVLPDGSPIVLESLSETPRVFRIFNLFTHDEADALIDNALHLKGPSGLKRSTVGNAKRGQKEDGSENAAHTDSGRTSDNAWDHSSPAAKKMISRSFALTRMEEDVGKIDGLQIVRYQPGQGYNTHPDYFGSGPRSSEDQDFDFNPYSGGSNRFATVFMYLNDVEEGGSTCFPRAPGLVPREQATPPSQHAMDMFRPNSWEHRLTQQCSYQLAVPPKRGTAALFYSSKPNGQIDPMSHHGACPVIKGLKWGANIWLWNKQRYGDIKTGLKRSLHIVNHATETVYLTWEGRDNGVLRPGQTSSIGTFQYHRFKAHYGFHKNKAFNTFTVQESPETQTWTIEDSPRHLQEWKNLQERQEPTLQNPYANSVRAKGGVAQAAAAVTAAFEAKQKEAQEHVQDDEGEFSASGEEEGDAAEQGFVDDADDDFDDDYTEDSQEGEEL